MSYAGQEESVELGRPVELYLFQSLTETFAYTSAPESITFNATTYTPKAISRSEPSIRGSTADSDATLTVTLPIGDPLAQRYVSGVPAGQDELTVYRRHSNDGPTPETIVFFEGLVDSMAVRGNEALIAVRPQSSKFRRTTPKRKFQAPCAHVLYDLGCGISDSDPNFAFPVVVTAISADGATVTVSGTGLSAQASDFFLGGVLRQGGVDRRMVLTQNDLGGDVMEVTVLIPFQDLSTGTNMTLLAGCDHSVTTCRDKFDNVDRYGGFPFIPTKNPFDTGIIL